MRSPAPASRPVPSRAASRAAVGLGLFVVAMAVTGALGRYVNRDVAGTEFMRFWPLLVVGAVSYGSTGGWLAAARPRLPLGWWFLGVGAALAVSDLGAEYAIAVVARHPDWLGASPALWLGAWLWAPAYLVVALVLPLVLPDGRLATASQRPALVVAALATVASSVVFAVTPYPEQSPPMAIGDLTNPTGTEWYDAWWLRWPATALLLASLVTGLVVLVRRWFAAGRSGAASRRALSTVVLGMLLTVVVGLLAFAVPSSWEPYVVGLAAVPLPVSCVVAVLRDRLWGVDVVLSRALVYAVLTSLAVLVYVAIVGTLGAVLGSTTGAPAVATAVVAVLALPAHRRVQRLVNRLVHGEVEDPYDALARLGDRLEAAQDPQVVGDLVLPEVVAAITRAVRVPAALELRDGSVVVSGSRPGTGATRIPLAYAGEALGSLVVATRSGGLGGRERQLLAGLARQAAVAVHGLLLGRDLQHSRELLVRAREEERRRLRRDLHDGVGPALAAAALQVETARDVYDRDPVAASALLDRAVTRLQDAVRDVRGVVHGLRPANLDDLGLVDAVAELAARFEVPGRQVCVSLSDVPGRTAAVDAAAYLVAAEALANASRHAAATRVEVELGPSRGGLLLRVRDDGRGLPEPAMAGVGLASMRERAAELAGTLTVGPAAPSGTAVELWLPVVAP